MINEYNILYTFYAQTRPNLTGQIYLLSRGCEIKSLETANTCSL